MTELDPKLNLLPEVFFSRSPKDLSIHLIGVGGVAMAALAGLLKKAGYQVSGSDEELYPPMSGLIKELAVEFHEGYGLDSLPQKIDLAVIGNVVTKKFPVLETLKKRELPYLSLPQALNRFFLKATKNLVVAGCHGKTTTTALAAKLWAEAGLNPSFLIGGASLDFPQPFQLGPGGWFIIEGDEYDSAFFNKVPKFVHYRPQMVILTSVEFDHADIYPDLQAVKAAYRSLLELIPEDGCLVACGDDPLVRELAGVSAAPVYFYGFGEKNDWRIVNPDENGQISGFELSGPGGFYGRLSLGKPGRYNMLNAAAAAAAYFEAGGNPKVIVQALAGFKGVKRRQELIGSFGGIILIDDFAHHPTAVAETLSGLRKAYPKGRLLAAFEPRSNTSRRNIFQEAYAHSFKEADLAFLRRPPVRVGDEEAALLNVDRLIGDIGPKARLFEDGQILGAALLNEARSGDVIVVMSNGGFDGLAVFLAKELALKFSGF